MDPAYKTKWVYKGLFTLLSVIGFIRWWFSFLPLGHGFLQLLHIQIPGSSWARTHKPTLAMMSKPANHTKHFRGRNFTQTDGRTDRGPAEVHWRWFTHQPQVHVWSRTHPAGRWFPAETCYPAKPFRSILHGFCLWLKLAIFFEFVGG